MKHITLIALSSIQYFSNSFDLSGLHLGKLCEKKLLVIVSRKGPQWLGLWESSLKVLHALDFFLKMQFPKLLELLKQPHLKMKMVF